MRPCGGQVAEAEQGLRHLDVDQPRLDVPRLVRPVWTRPAWASARPMQARALAASPSRAYALACMACRSAARAGVMWSPAARSAASAKAMERRCSPRNSDWVTRSAIIAAKPPVAAGLGEPQRLVEVALGEPVGVGVVRADAGDRHQPGGRAVQAAAEGVAVAAAQQRRGLRVEEAHDPGPGRDPARLAVHLLVVVAGRQHRYVRLAHPDRPRARDVHVLRGVLPLPDRHHLAGPRDGGHGGQAGAVLFVQRHRAVARSTNPERAAPSAPVSVPDAWGGGG
ncbi:hypothetical protein SCALM49S_08278 [Streptomyces californicus]